MTAWGGLRGEVETAALAALAKEGPGFRRAVVAEAFAGRGVSRATVYRWISHRLAVGDGGPDAGMAVGARIRQLVADVRRRADALPDAIALDALALKLVGVIGAAADLVREAQGPDGGIRKPRLLLDALDLLRRTLVNAAELAALDSGVGDALFREPILKELATLLEPPTLGAPPTQDGGQGRAGPFTPRSAASLPSA